MTTKQITKLENGMEVMEASASTPEQAAKLGQEQAARYTARGYAYECVGVVAYSALVDVSDKEDGYCQINRRGFRPVLRAL